MWHDAQHEGVAIPGRSAIVWPEDQPSIRCRECCPVVPVSTKTVAICICRAAMDERKHTQVMSTLLARRIDQHAVYCSSICGFPMVGFPCHLRPLSEDRIESGQQLGGVKV